MTDFSNDGSRKNVWIHLSIADSLSSLAALAIVLVEKSGLNGMDPQRSVWRVALIVISFLAIGVTSIISYDVIRSIASSKIISFRMKILRSFAVLSLGILAVSIFADGLFAALYWHWWLRGLTDFLSSYIQSSTG